MTALVPFNTPDAFPVFASGDVIITIELGPSAKTFQLHSFILARHSPFFSRSLQKASLEHPGSTWHNFTVQEVDGSIKLIYQYAEGERPDVTHSDSIGVPGVYIKTEDDNMAATTPGGDTPDPQKGPTRSMKPSSNFDMMGFYALIFGAFYNISPKISSTDIANALVQAEELVKIANELSCLHLLRPYLENTFGQYRQKLYIAIKSDPARWLLLSMSLESTPMYTECLIHLIGVHPAWPWPTKRSVLPQEVRDFIIKKSKELDELCVEVDRELLKLTVEVKVGSDHKPVSFYDASQHEIWMVVAIFRDGVAARLHAIEKTRREAVQRGTLYRCILRGGDAYMEYEAVKDQCTEYVNSGWKDLGEDLKLVKRYAADIVEELGVNELMIDPDAHGIGYLTCAKVEPKDIPWAADTTI